MDSNTYHPPLIFAFGNDLVRVHRPVLTEEERAKRMEEIKRAAVRLVLESEKAKRQKLKHNKKGEEQ